MLLLSPQLAKPPREPHFHCSLRGPRSGQPLQLGCMLCLEGPDTHPTWTSLEREINVGAHKGNFMDSLFSA